MQQNIPCDLCGQTIPQEYASFLPRFPFHLVRCQQCGLVYLDPRPAPEEIGDYYTSEYYTSLPPQPIDGKTWQQLIKTVAYKSRCQHTSHEVSATKRFFLRLARPLIGWRARRYVPVRPHGRLLDVGCGNGQWAAWLRDNIPGWEAEGVEINPYAAAQAREAYKLKVHVGHLEEVGLEAENYDMISFWHSLEHVYSPQATLREAHRLLRPGGWVGIELPNIESWEARLLKEKWYHLAPPVHLYHFSADTLQAMLVECGFQVVVQQSVRNHISLSHAVQQGHIVKQPLLRRFLYIISSTIGRLSPWGIRLYAVKL